MSARCVRSQRIFSEKQFWHVFDNNTGEPSRLGGSNAFPGCEAVDMAAVFRLRVGQQEYACVIGAGGQMTERRKIARIELDVRQPDESLLSSYLPLLPQTIVVVVPQIDELLCAKALQNVIGERAEALPGTDQVRGGARKSAWPTWRGSQTEDGQGCQPRSYR